MALTVAELQVLLEGQTKQFDQKLRASETRLKSFEKTGNRATKSVGGGLARIGTVAGPAIAALGVTVLATRLIAASANVTAFTDAIGKQADSVGTTTQFLQEFRVAVSLTGGTVGGADKALTKLNRNIAEAAEGTGPAADAFQQLGIPLDEISGLPLPDVVGRIAEGIKNLETPAQRTAAAIDLFGRSGDKLVNTFANGVEGLDAFRQRARDTGQVIEDSLIRRAEALNDRFELANDRLRNATIPILTDLREGMTIFAEAATTALNAITGLSEQEVIRDASIQNVTRTANEIVRLEGEVERLAIVIERQRDITSEDELEALRQRRNRVGNLLTLERDRLAGLIRTRAEQQGLARDINTTLNNAEKLAVSRFEFFTEEQAAAEADRIRDTFDRQQELATIREETIGDELRAIDAAKKAEAEKDRVALVAIDAKLTKEIELRDLRLAATSSLLELEQMLAREQVTGGDPLRERLADLDDQIQSAQEQARVAAEDPRAQEAATFVVGTLTERRAEVTQRINDLEMANASLAQLLQARASALLDTDRQRAITLQEQLDSLLAQQLPLEETQRRLRDILEGDVPGEDGAGAMQASSIASNISSALFTGLTGGLDGFGDSLLETVITATSDGTKTGFENVEDFVTGSLTKGIQGAAGALGGLFDRDGGEGGGGIFGRFSKFIGGEEGREFLGSAVGLGANVIQAFRSGAESEAGTAVSAVTSVERVRGIVAGPTSLAVAQVDRGIQDAFLPTEFLLRRIEENTRASASNTSDTGTGSVPTGGTSEATQALANEGPSLV